MCVQDREHVVLPRQPDHTSEALLAKLSIAKAMEFTSQTLRSGVVVWSDDGPRGSALLFLRGAPAVIRDMVQPNTVPSDFNQVSNHYCLVGWYKMHYFYLLPSVCNVAIAVLCFFDCVPSASILVVSDKTCHAST